MGNDFSWLDSFENSYQPQQGFRPSVDTLGPGDYDFEIVDAAFDRINSKEVLRVGLRVAGGLVVERVYWLEEQRVVNGLCADLLTLGFDADRWGAARQRPLSVELPKAVARLRGVRFRGAKRTRAGTGQNAGKTFHDFYVLARLGGSAPVASPSADAAPPPMPVTRASAAAGGDDEIPF